MNIIFNMFIFVLYIVFYMVCNLIYNLHMIFIFLRTVEMFMESINSYAYLADM